MCAFTAPPKPHCGIRNFSNNSNMLAYTTGLVPSSHMHICIHIYPIRVRLWQNLRIHEHIHTHTTRAREKGSNPAHARPSAFEYVCAWLWGRRSRGWHTRRCAEIVRALHADNGIRKVARTRIGCCALRLVCGSGEEGFMMKELVEWTATTTAFADDAKRANLVFYKLLVKFSALCVCVYMCTCVCGVSSHVVQWL